MKLSNNNIGAVADVIAGQSPPSNLYNKTGNGLPFYQGKTDFGEKYPEAKTWCIGAKNKEAIKNDILLSVRAPVGPVNICQVRSVIGRGLSAIRAKKGNSFEYLFYYLKNHEQDIAKLGTGSTFKAITQTHKNRIQLPIPESFDDQIRIATVLTHAERLIAKRKEGIKALDELLKSTFLEMFGPNNPEFHKWPIVEIRGLAAAHKGAMRTGPFGSNLLHSAFTESGDVAVLGIDNAVQNKFAWGEKRFISKKKYSELGNYRILPGDVIITIMGTIGRSAVIPDDIPLAINTKHLAAITVNHDLVNPHFLSYSIHSSPFIIDQFSRKNRGAIMNGLHLVLIKEKKINKPPINLQNQFGSIILKVESIKTKQAHSLAELESLFGSLSQIAFKGELDLSRVPVVYVEAEPLETKAFSADVKVTKAFSKDELINILKAKAV